MYLKKYYRQPMTKHEMLQKQNRKVKKKLYTTANDKAENVTTVSCKA